MNKGLIILGVLFGLNVLAWVAVYDLSRAQLLEVVFFDVGQGDSIFIETPQGHQVLIDGGPDETVIEKLGDEMPFWDRTIDLVILTHPEKDHLVGLLEVLKRYRVENILWTGIIRDTAEYREWQKLIKEEGADVFIAQAGQNIKLARNDIANLEVLYPFKSLEGQEMKDSNNTSVIVKLVYGENSFLFTGDIAKSVERKLINEGTEIDADVLKVGHHGSKNSSAEEFIKAVSPEIAVIQVGQDNSYGHPSEETLAILEKYGVNILRTDINGTVRVLTDGKKYKIEVSK